MESDMSLLDQELCDEYLRCERALAAHEGALARSKKGYVSRKLINGRERFYLQWREGGRVLSRYIPSDKAEESIREVDERRVHELSVRRLKKDMGKIKRVVGEEAIEGYRMEMGL